MTDTRAALATVLRHAAAKFADGQVADDPVTADPTVRWVAATQLAQ